MGKYIICLIGFLMIVSAGLPFFRHQEFTARQAAVCKCICFKCQSSTNGFYAVGDSIGKLSDLNAFKEKPKTNEWEQGQFVTFKRIYPHQRCGGQLVFNGQSKPAPYSEKESFYTHVCDKCSATNEILNATWPQYKQEWRAL